MKFSVTVLASLAVTYAAPVTVTSIQYVVATTRYTTLTINNAPLATASVATGSPASADTPASTTATPTSTVPPSTKTSTSLTSTKTSTSATSTKASASTTSKPATTPATSTTSAASSATSSQASLNSFEAEILSEHNKKRALHGVADLTWNAELAEYAADYAANSFSCANVQLIHSHGPYGENLAAGYVGGASPVDAWYSEISQYDYSNPGFSEATGHFTQVVWKSTTQVGCAKVTCDNEWRQYTICEYSPAGNIVSSSTNYFELNVLPLV